MVLACHGCRLVLFGRYWWPLLAWMTRSVGVHSVLWLRAGGLQIDVSIFLARRSLSGRIYRTAFFFFQVFPTVAQLTVKPIYSQYSDSGNLF